MILTVSFLTVVSQLLIKKGVTQLHLDSFSVGRLVDIATSPYILGSLMLQVLGYIIWVLVLSRANIGYAVAFSGSFFYIILPILSWLIYGERLTSVQWIGLSLICTGIFCMMNKGTS